ncbi:MAG: 2-phosphosulfolactate phosphatase [Pseudomonadota bacterium]
MGKCKIGIGRSLSNDLRDDENVIVIDNLRASSTIVTALSLGVEQIIPVVDDREAFLLKEKGCILAGETGCIKIDGYDIGNSPVELVRTYSARPFKKLVIKTSNLIPLLLTLRRAVICSSLNLAAIANFLNNKGACILAAGGPRGAAEDLGVAFALAACLAGVSFDKDLAIAFTAESPAAKYLHEIGSGDDVAFISRVNVYDVVPLYDGKVIKKL